MVIKNIGIKIWIKTVYFKIISVSLALSNKKILSSKHNNTILSFFYRNGDNRGLGILRKWFV